MSRRVTRGASKAQGAAEMEDAEMSEAQPVLALPAPEQEATSQASEPHSLVPLVPPMPPIAPTTSTSLQPLGAPPSMDF